MKSSAKKVELASVDDLFSTEESRADAQRERVMELMFLSRLAYFSKSVMVVCFYWLHLLSRL